MKTYTVLSKNPTTAVQRCGVDHSTK